MLRPFLLLVILCVGCGPSKPTPSKEVSHVGVEELCRIYRHNPKDKTFAGRLVQCQLEPRSYRVRPGVIEACIFAVDRPGCIQFECGSAPADDSKRLIVTGRVWGTVKDGIVREATTDFYLRVTDSSVTVLEP